ncbi:sensor histidine kinase [Paracoccus sp. NGMCC 1.201697]|uniref:Oxygen sensor histidine kinase NreB n=1 Tax=Paracoccus broussonetiae subsp. drimophilus TaxID=3373869 RepID=A0ABW7LNX0_9RHOB
MIATTQTGPAHWRRRIAAIPLHHRFAIVGSIVTLLGMVAVGSLVSDSIKTSVVRNAALSSAVYMESFIAPMSQELTNSQTLSPASIQRMRDLLDEPPMSERVLSTKIWRKGGLIAFSSDADLIGKVLEPGEKLRRAWAGELSASFDDLDEAENAREQMKGIPLLEVYNPIHSILTGKIIAVAEFYLDGSELKADLRAAQTRAWAAVAGVMALTFAALFGIVRAGSRTIDAQNRELTGRLAELARVSTQNKALRERVQAASRGVSETNERYMRRISAELHDGPAQALALTSLRLDALMRRASVPPDDPEARGLRASLDEAMGDVRDLCRGLTLPTLEGRSVAETLELAISAHERRTATTVQRRFSGDERIDRPAPHPILICAYRFTQEALMNAWRHANDAPVTASCGLSPDGRLEIAVEDGGPGFDPRTLNGHGLGLSGLRERVESIGGEFDIRTAPGQGTRLTITLSPEALA